MNCRRFRLCICAAMVLGSAAAHGQGFMVKPMTIPLDLRPRLNYVTSLSVRNTLTDRAQTVRFTVMGLRQGESGNFEVFPFEPDARPTHISNWLKLSENELEIEPLQTGTIQLQLKVPPGVRGFHGAAVLVASVPEERSQGVMIVLNFVVKVLVKIQGPPARKRVDLLDAEMNFLPVDEDRETAHTQIGARLENSGEVLVEAKGEIHVFHQAGPRWRRVRTIDVGPMQILPGSRVLLSREETRGFPSGKYRLEARMIVDSRRIRPFSKEIDFVGDPTVAALGEEVEFSVEPGRLEVSGVPRARRTGYVSLRNPSDEPLTIQVTTGQPSSLRGVSMGEITGDDFSAHQWITVQPPKFRLQAGRSQRVRVQLAFPEDASPMPYYYSKLNFTAEFPDGQPAGSHEMLVIARNDRETPEANLQTMSAALAQESETQYGLTMTVGNTGNVHLNPACDGWLETGSGFSTGFRFGLEREPGLVLPLGKVTFNGMIDFAKIDPGVYIVRTNTKYGDGQILTQTLPIRVSDGEDGKIVEVIDLEETGGTASEETGGTTSVSSEDAEAEAAAN